ncbi:MAG TPA: S8 family serine peptidase, partial [Acidimicrobiia bacterium]|nr:S8 family serine peptidase [Acidimicrobiia bacterium]
AKIVVRGLVDSMGVIDELTLAGTIDELEDALPLHILNLSLGGYLRQPFLYTKDGRTELTIRDRRVQPGGLPAVAAAIEKLRRTCFERHGIRLVVVAAAGNNGKDTPFYPAALPSVIGVGALNQDYSKVIWSNYGHWVDAWEIGSDVVSSFVGADLRVRGGGGDGKDGAIWGGTSFAAPRLAGRLAAAMTV